MSFNDCTSRVLCIDKRAPVILSSSVRKKTGNSGTTSPCYTERARRKWRYRYKVKKSVLPTTGPLRGKNTTSCGIPADYRQAIRRPLVAELARISQTQEMHRAANLRESLCDDDSSMIQGEPRCRQSVHRSCSNLKPLIDVQWWPVSMAGTSPRAQARYHWDR